MKPTQGEVIRERWLRGRLGYKLHAGQVKLNDFAYVKDEVQALAAQLV
jgi:hypothetical protein